MMLYYLLKLTTMLSIASVIPTRADNGDFNKSLSIIGGNDTHFIKETSDLRPKNGTGRQKYKELVDKLFENHSPVIPPNAGDLTTPVNLSIEMVLENLAYLDMKSQTLNIMAWFQIEWHDPAFSWDTDIYPIDMIVVNEKEIWRPSLAISNTLLPRDQIMTIELPVSIFSNGNIRWFPGDSFIMNCHVDLKFYPFDVQTCAVVVTQWSHSLHHINCTQANVRSSVKGNGEWSITDMGYYYKLLHEADYSFWVLTYTITLERKWTFYAINIIFPIILVSALNAVVFILPVGSGDKMSVSVTTFLTLVLFLTMIQDSLANNSDTVCYLTLYLAVQTTLGALAIVQSAIVVACHHRTTLDEDDHPEKSSNRRQACTFSQDDDELAGYRVLNAQKHFVKANDQKLPHGNEYYSVFAPGNPIQSGQFPDGTANETKCSHRSNSRKTRTVQDAANIGCKSSSRDWTGLAAKIDSICFPVFVGLNVASLFVFCVIILSA